MICASFDDPNLVENVTAALNLKKTGMFTDKEIQEMYDDQVRRDKEAKEKEKQ